MMACIQNNILAQSARAMLAQDNPAAQGGAPVRDRSRQNLKNTATIPGGRGFHIRPPLFLPNRFSCAGSLRLRPIGAVFVFLRRELPIVFFSKYRPTKASGF